MQNYSIFSPAPLMVYTTSNGSTSVSSAGNFYARFRDLTSSGIVKSNFHDPNYWTFNRRTRSNHMDAWYSEPNLYRRYVGPYWNMPEGLNTWHEAELSWVDSQALTKLIEEIRGGLDLSVDAFQLRQTLSLVRDLRKIVDRTVVLVADTLIRKRVGLGSKAAKKAAYKTRLIKRLGQRYNSGLRAPRDFDVLKIPGDLWLGYVYGVKPTLQSIHDTIASTKNHYYNLSKMFHGKKTSTRSDVVNLPSYLDGTWKARVQIRSSVRVYYKVRLQIPDEPLTQLARFTSLNPVSIAWELLPWSFVIDWFLPIGDYLRNLESYLVYNQYFKSGFKTTSWSYEGELAGSRTTVAGASVGGVHACSSLDRYMKREVLTSLPVPAFPNFRAELGSGRLLNAAALLTSFLRH